MGSRCKALHELKTNAGFQEIKAVSKVHNNVDTKPRKCK